MTLQRRASSSGDGRLVRDFVLTSTGAAFRVSGDSVVRSVAIADLSPYRRGRDRNGQPRQFIRGDIRDRDGLAFVPVSDNGEGYVREYGSTFRDIRIEEPTADDQDPALAVVHASDEVAAYVRGGEAGFVVLGDPDASLDLGPWPIGDDGPVESYGNISFGVTSGAGYRNAIAIPSGAFVFGLDAGNGYLELGRTPSGPITVDLRPADPPHGETVSEGISIVRPLGFSGSRVIVQVVYNRRKRIAVVQGSDVTRTRSEAWVHLLEIESDGTIANRSETGSSTVLWDPDQVDDQGNPQVVVETPQYSGTYAVSGWTGTDGSFQRENVPVDQMPDPSDRALSFPIRLATEDEAGIEVAMTVSGSWRWRSDGGSWNDIAPEPMQDRLAFSGQSAVVREMRFASREFLLITGGE